MQMKWHNVSNCLFQRAVGTFLNNWVHAAVKERWSEGSLLNTKLFLHLPVQQISQGRPVALYWVDASAVVKWGTAGRAIGERVSSYPYTFKSTLTNTLMVSPITLPPSTPATANLPMSSVLPLDPSPDATGSRQLWTTQKIWTVNKFYWNTNDTSWRIMITK